MYTQICIYMYVYIYVYINTYIHVYKHKNIYIHTYIYRRLAVHQDLMVQENKKYCPLPTLVTLCGAALQSYQHFELKGLEFINMLKFGQVCDYK
jgi:hypothetical protein